MTTLHLYNARIPSTALVDLTRPERALVSPTPVLCPEGEECFFIVLTGDVELPLLLTRSEIVALGGEVPEAGDMLLARDGRKLWIGDRCFEMRFADGRREFVAC